MSEQTGRKPAARLQPPRRARPALIRRLVWITWPLLAVALTASFFLCRAHTTVDPQPSDCLGLPRSAPLATLVLACRTEYQRTGDPTVGLRLASALRLSDDLGGAKIIANALRETSKQADALHLLGLIARDEGHVDEAIRLLESARRQHRAEHSIGGVARDCYALANIHADRKEYIDALSLLDECINASREAGDKNSEFIGHLSANRTLLKVGYIDLAFKELKLAEPLALSDQERTQLLHRRGCTLQEAKQHDRATNAFEAAIKINESAQISGFTRNAELDLAYSLAELNDPSKLDEAERHLERAEARRAPDSGDDHHTQIAARIAYHRGNLELASRLNEQAWPNIDEDADDERIDVAVMQARIALAQSDLAKAQGDLARAQGDLAKAETWAQRGVEVVERMAAKQDAVELRSRVMGTRREPYEIWFVTLAHAGRFDDAAMAIAQWQGRTVLDALARRSTTPPTDLRSAATALADLTRLLLVVSRAPFAKLSERGSVIGAMQSIDLLALVVAERDVWSLTVRHGPPTLHNLGSLAELQTLLEEFRATPADPAIASRLGATILRDGLFRPTPEALYLLLDDKLAGLPVAALRRDDVPLFDVRPSVRVLRLPDAPCVAPTRPKQAVVLADPDGTLPNAREEGRRVAGVLGARSLMGSAATIASLFTTTPDSLLHIAGHTDSAAGEALILSDGKVSALEVSAHQVGPALVVLSACGSASSSNGAIGSLAAAFVAAGSTHVIATLQAVSDEAALEFSTLFYGADGAYDPVSGLAAVQSRLSRSKNTAWPQYVVFGPDICTH